MSAEEVTNPAEDAPGDTSAVSQGQNVDKAIAGDKGCAAEKENSTVPEKPQSGASMPDTEPKVHNTAHEGDREKQASHRIKEAQRYHERDKDTRKSSRGGRGGYKNNNRFDPTKQEKSDDPVAIRKQVEFYFSESNLLTDKFLFERVKGHKNIPVPIDIIHSFKRMQHFQPREAVVEALKQSSVLVVVENDTAIRRKEPLPENLTGKSMDEVQKVHEDRSMAKSIYAKGFGEEEPTTQFDIEAWFANYGLTNSVRLRRDHQKSFKGSVFVEFDTEETQQKFLALDPPAKWKGTSLEIKSKKQYCDAKVDDINEGRIRRTSPTSRYEDRKDKRPRWSSSTHDNKSHDYSEGDDDRDWRQRRTEEGNRSSKWRGHESSGRRGRKRPYGGRGGRDRNAERREKDFENAEPTLVGATTPARATHDTEKEDQLDKNEHSKDTVKTSLDTPAASEQVKRKRAHEDEGDEEIQKTTKKVNLEGAGD